MTIDHEALGALYERARWTDMTVAQAFVEHWDLPAVTEVEAEAREARDEWARAVAVAWPELRVERDNALAEVARLRVELDEARATQNRIAQYQRTRADTLAARLERANALVHDLADVLARMVVGWEDIIGHDLAKHPEVVRVMARYREHKENS